MMNLDLHKKALILSYITVGYNVIEGTASVIVGFFAGSIALVGFGSDSFVESLSGIIMIWRFKKHGKVSIEMEKQIEKKASKFVSISFIILGTYVLYESISKLYFQEISKPSSVGIIIATASIIIMPILFYMKYQTGKSINSKSLIADSKQTLACLMMSFSLLVGLGLNYLYGIWQADSIVGIIIVIFLFKEGYYTYKEEEICNC